MEEIERPDVEKKNMHMSESDGKRESIMALLSYLDLYTEVD